MDAPGYAFSVSGNGSGNDGKPKKKPGFLFYTKDSKSKSVDGEEGVKDLANDKKEIMKAAIKVEANKRNVNKVFNRRRSVKKQRYKTQPRLTFRMTDHISLCSNGRKRRSTMKLPPKPLTPTSRDIRATRSYASNPGDQNKSDPCKKKEDPGNKNEDPCKKTDKSKDDPCKKKEDPCKKNEDPGKEKGSEKVKWNQFESCRKEEKGGSGKGDSGKKEEDPCKKKEDPSEKKKDPCEKKKDLGEKKEDPCKSKGSEKVKGKPLFESCRKEEKGDSGKGDSCKKKDDPPGKKKDPCEKKKDAGAKKEDPCKGKDSAKEVNWGQFGGCSKKDDSGNKTKDPCTKPKESDSFSKPPKKEKETGMKPEPTFTSCKSAKPKKPCGPRKLVNIRSKFPWKKVDKAAMKKACANQSYLTKKSQKDDTCDKKPSPPKPKPCASPKKKCSPELKEKKPEDCLRGGTPPKKPPCPPKKEDPCKKKPEPPKKKADPCKKNDEKKCELKESRKDDCSLKTGTEPKKPPGPPKKEDPCKKKPEPPKKKPEPPKKKADPVKKNDEKKCDVELKASPKDDCSLKTGTPPKKDDPCKKKEDPSKKKEDPSKTKEDPCKKKEDPRKKKDDPCEKKEDPCKKKEDPCKKKEDPCKKKEDPCKKKEDPYKKKEDPCKKNEDPCKQKKDPCEDFNKKQAQKDPCAKKDPCKSSDKKDDGGKGGAMVVTPYVEKHDKENIKSCQCEIDSTKDSDGVYCQLKTTESGEQFCCQQGLQDIKNNQTERILKCKIMKDRFNQNVLICKEITNNIIKDTSKTAAEEAAEFNSILAKRTHKLDETENLVVRSDDSRLVCMKKPGTDEVICSVMKVKEIIVEEAKEEQVITEKKCTYKDILEKQKALVKQHNRQILERFRK